MLKIWFIKLQKKKKSTLKNSLFLIWIIGRVYSPPVKLRKRKEVANSSPDKPVEANFDATGVELHKDSKFYQSWENFKVELIFCLFY